MNKTIPYDISAEFLLNQFYPDWMDEWTVDCAGTFYRNYSPDLLAVDEETRTVRLARDSFLRLLPEGMIAKDNALRGENFKEKHERLLKRKEILRELFKPIDTLAFRFRLHAENQARQLSREGLTFLLRHYFSYDLDKESDPYIQKIAPLLPFVSHLRANYAFLRDLLAQLFGHEVEMRRGKYHWEEGSAYAMPAVGYFLLIPDLTAEDYAESRKAIEPLERFIREWFIPFDTYCVIRPKWHGKPSTLGEALTLDYDTELTPQNDSSTPE